MTNTEQERWVDKITKLLNKANDKATTPEEAELLFGKAQELMTKWMIDDAMLNAARMAGHADDPVEVQFVMVPSTYARAVTLLYDVVARANDCRTVYSQLSGGKRRVHIVGFRSDIERVLLLVTSLDMQAAMAARRATQEQGKDGWDSYVWKRSFREAFASRIGQRLIEVRTATVQDASAGAGSNLPAILDTKKRDVEEFFRKMYPNLGIGRSGGRRQHSWDGASAGRAAADRADIGLGRMGKSSTRGELR